MKKLMMITAAAMALGMAGAQTWKTADGSLTLKSCYKSEDYVTCEVNYTLTDSDTGSLRWPPSKLVYYLADGTSGEAYSISVAGGDFSRGYGEASVIKGISTTILFALDLPPSTASIRALVIFEHRIDNVPIRASATAPAPAPAPRPATTTTTPVNTGAYNAVLTNCKSGENGTLTCGATLTPRR